MSRSRLRHVLMAVVAISACITLLGLHPSTRSRLVDLSSNVAPATWFAPISVLMPSIAGIRIVMDEDHLPIHPIIELIKEGNAKAKAIEKKRADVTTLMDAVRDYREAFEMDPPEGFDKWYALARSVNSTVASSLIPLAHTSVLPFLSLPPELLRQRANESLHIRSMFAFRLAPGAGDAGVEMIEMDDVSKRRVTPL